MALLGPIYLRDATSSVDDQFRRSATRTYRANFGLSDDEAYVRSHLSLTGPGGPVIAIGAAHPTDPAMLLLGIRVALDVPERTTYVDPLNAANPNNGAACYLWSATLEFGPWSPIDHHDGNPLNQPVRYRVNSNNASEVVWLDTTGLPIVNSAGDPYDPPVERESVRITLSLMRNESAPAVTTLLQLANKTNAADWNGFPAGTVKLEPFNLPEKEYDQANNVYFYAMEYTFRVDFLGWKKTLLNAGLRELGPDGKIRPILVAGTPASTPVPLDEAGHAILTPAVLDSTGGVPPDAGATTGPDKSRGTNTGTGTADAFVVDEYVVYPPTDFTVLDSGYTDPKLQLSAIFTA